MMANSFVFVHESSNRRPVTKNLRLFFQRVASPLGQKSRPDVPV